MLGGYIILPYAIEVDGQIIKLYDPLNHKIVAMPAAPEPARLAIGGVATTTATQPDRRWLVCKRPQVVVGGEVDFGAA